jgi:hypothetical protein
LRKAKHKEFAAVLASNAALFLKEQNQDGEATAGQATVP